MSKTTYRPLEFLLSLVTTRTSASKNQTWPYIGLEHMPSGGTSIAAFGSAEESISTNGIFYPGDVLFGKLRPRLRKTLRADRPGYCSTDVLVLRPNEAVDPVFASYVAQSETVFSAAIRTEEGTKMPRCSWRDLRGVKVFCPDDRRLQKKIALILGSTDITIEKTEALIAKYQQIKVGLMHDLFTRGVLPNGKLRSPSSEAPELYTETALGWIPKEWNVSGLAAMGRPGISWIRTGPFGSALKGEHWRTHGHPVITIGALGEGVFTQEDLLFVDARDAARLTDFQLKHGDVVFSRVADVGRSAVVRKNQIGWIMSSNLMRIAVDEMRARPDFLQMALAGDARIKSQIRARVNSGGRDVANSEVLNQLRFVWPDIAEQDRIIELSSRVSRNLEIEQQRAEKLRQQKLGLMQDLLTGKLPVKTDEPEATHA